MFFQLRELLRWLGLTVFEIWVALVSFTVFTVLLTLKAENLVGENLTWWIVFSPLFVSDAFNAYFCVIVFIRMYLEGNFLVKSSSKHSKNNSTSRCLQICPGTSHLESFYALFAICVQILAVPEA